MVGARQGKRAEPATAHHAVLRVPRGRNLGLRDARAGRDRLLRVDHLDRDRPTGADRAAAR